MGSANAGPSYIIDDILKAAVVEGIELERHPVEAVFSSSDIPAVWKEFHPEPLSGLEFAPWLFQLSPSHAYISSRDIVLMSDRLLRPLEGDYWWNAVRLCVWSTTESIFIIRQQQEKYIAANEPLYFAFVDIKKAFDRVPRKVLWWALRSLSVDEWAEHVIQGTYSNALSRVWVDGQYSEEFGVAAGVLSHEFCTGLPWELLYADELVLTLGPPWRSVYFPVQGVEGWHGK